MRVSKEQAAQNRAALIDAAGRLFREHGIDGVGVADICRSAGLTHGALYAHFDSKGALAAEALAKGMDHSLAAMRRSGQGAVPSYEDHLDFLLSRVMRDELAGCPLTASASEVARQGDALSAGFADGFMGMATQIEAAIGEDVPAAERRSAALAFVAAQIGAITVARAVARSEPALSDDVLQAVRSMLADAQGDRLGRRKDQA